MRWGAIGWLMLGGCALALVACGSEVTVLQGGTSTTNGCTPGDPKACYGPGQCPGAQVCKANGSGWSSCDCGTGASGNAGGYGAAGNAGGYGASGNAGGYGAGPLGGAAGFGGIGGWAGAGGVGGIGGAAGSGGGVLQWDATSDFSPIANPNGVWSSGWTATLGSPLNLFDGTCVYGASVVWDDPALGNSCEGGPTPAFWKNTSAQIEFGVHPGQISLHPGQAGEYAVLRWTAPLSASCTVHAQFFAGDIGDTDAHIVHNDVPILFAGTTGSNPQFHHQMAVIAGDTVDWVVGFKGDWWNDNTPISAVVTCH